MNAYEQIRYALTEAKGWLIECLNKEYPPTEDSINHAIDQIDAALSEPPRQCDVGTAQEQASRMRQFCTKQKRNGIINCGYCPIKHEYQRDCTLSWAQMPYEAQEGGKE